MRANVVTHAVLTMERTGPPVHRKYSGLNIVAHQHVVTNAARYGERLISQSVPCRCSFPEYLRCRDQT